ncbi:hypothetical protein LSH36_568g03048 [Paralvinella palmiformis]|uniref:Glycosyltransferase n=1 Tax=Paralvinella palmiformis TaxID=53620 RepID=A0AAD9MVN8_9ANNE|nr:hypothetical protein LSH36_568g03048 [Paralvinella palmiformis]
MSIGKTRRLAARNEQSCSGHSLAKKYHPSQNMPDNSATIIGGMMLIQKVAGHTHTFDNDVLEDYINNSNIANVCENYSAAAERSRLVNLDILANNNTVHIQKRSITLVTHLSWARVDRLVLVLKHWEGPSSISLYGAAKILPYYIKELRFMTESLKSPPIVHFVSEYPQIVIIPAFEETEASAIDHIFPTSKDDLLKLWERHKVIPFLSTICGGCQSATQYDTWKRATNTYQVTFNMFHVFPGIIYEPYLVFSSFHILLGITYEPNKTLSLLQVFTGVTYQPYIVLSVFPGITYEPYILAHRPSLPPYSELFVGRNFNKIQYILHLHAMGFEFHVCPEVFVLHLWHERPETTDQNRKCSRWLFERFRRYLDENYACGSWRQQNERKEPTSLC